MDLPNGLWTEGRTPEQTRAMYADWAGRYEADMAEAGMVGTTLTARMLADVLGPDAPVHDFGCGTGLAGVALREAGFGAIDGSDLTPEMLDVARRKGIYRDLRAVGADEPPRFALDVRGVCASGVISVGAGPAGLLRAILEAMPEGGVLVMSYNADTLVHPDYQAALASVQTDRLAVLLRAEHGRQFTRLDRWCTIYALRRA